MGQYGVIRSSHKKTVIRNSRKETYNDLISDFTWDSMDSVGRDF